MFALSARRAVAVASRMNKRTTVNVRVLNSGCRVSGFRMHGSQSGSWFQCQGLKLKLRNLNLALQMQNQSAAIPRSCPVVFPHDLGLVYKEDPWYPRILDISESQYWDQGPREAPIIIVRNFQVTLAVDIE